jgi:hypothetical protein
MTPTLAKMNAITVSELEMLTFFEGQPTLRDQDVPWPYNEFLYKVSREDLSLSFALAPAYRSVNIILTQGEITLYEMSATGVEDVRYHSDKGREVIEVAICEKDKLWLRVKPSISLSHVSDMAR